MRISRLFVNQPLNANQSIELDDDNSHYVRTVLRLKKDDAIILFNGKGGEFSGLLTEVSRKRVGVQVNRVVIPERGIAFADCFRFGDFAWRPHGLIGAEGCRTWG